MAGLSIDQGSIVSLSITWLSHSQARSEPNHVSHGPGLKAGLSSGGQLEGLASLSASLGLAESQWHGQAI